MKLEQERINRAREQRDKALKELEDVRGERWIWLAVGFVLGWILF